MANEKTVLLCDNDAEMLTELATSLQSQGFEVSKLTDASRLVAVVRQSRPALVAVNPDMGGFDAIDVCKSIKQELGTPVVLLIDGNSTSRNTIDQCTADDVVQKPIDKQILAFLLQNHFAMHSKNDKSSQALS